MSANIEFRIEPNKPHHNQTFEKSFNNIGGAVFEMFPLQADDVILHWGEEQLRLSYRYVIGDIIEDLMWMVIELSAEDTAESYAVWPSNNFAGTWHFKWSSDDLEITAEWREEFNASQYLRENNMLKISKRQYLAEWRPVFEIIASSLSECGFTDEDAEDIGMFREALSILRDFS